MYARTVTFDLNSDMWEEALAFGASVTDQIAGFPGLRFWVLVGNRETGQRHAFCSVRKQASIRGRERRHE